AIPCVMREILFSHDTPSPFSPELNRRGFGCAGSFADSIFIPAAARSEEHTSELQSQSNLVCRLLLEKKKKKYAGRYTLRLRAFRWCGRRGYRQRCSSGRSKPRHHRRSLCQELLLSLICCMRVSGLTL